MSPETVELLAAARRDGRSPVDLDLRSGSAGAGLLAGGGDLALPRPGHPPAADPVQAAPRPVRHPVQRLSLDLSPLRRVGRRRTVEARGRHLDPAHHARAAPPRCGAAPQQSAGAWDARPSGLARSRSTLVAIAATVALVDAVEAVPALGAAWDLGLKEFLAAAHDVAIRPVPSRLAASGPTPGPPDARAELGRVGPRHSSGGGDPGGALRVGRPVRRRLRGVGRRGGTGQAPRRSDAPAALPGSPPGRFPGWPRPVGRRGHSCGRIWRPWCAPAELEERCWDSRRRLSPSPCSRSAGGARRCSRSWAGWRRCGPVSCSSWARNGSGTIFEPISRDWRCCAAIRCGARPSSAPRPPARPRS